MACAFDRCILVAAAPGAENIPANNDFFGGLPLLWQEWALTQAVALAGVRLMEGAAMQKAAVQRPLTAADVLELSPVSKSVRAILPPVNAVLREHLPEVGAVAGGRSRIDKAIGHMTAELAFRRKQSGQHVQIVSLLEDLASVFMLRTATVSHAVDVHKEIIDLVNARHGANSSISLRAQRELALCYCFQGHYDAARPILDGVLENSAPRSLERARTLQILGILASATGAYDMAEIHLGQALDIATACCASVESVAGGVASTNVVSSPFPVLSPREAAAAALRSATEVRAEVFAASAQLLVKEDKLLLAREAAVSAVTALRSDAVLCSLPVFAVALHALAGVMKRLGAYDLSSKHYVECCELVCLCVDRLSLA